MKRLQAVTGMFLAAALLTSGILPPGTLTAQAAEQAERITKVQDQPDAAVNDEIEAAAGPDGTDEAPAPIDQAKEEPRILVTDDLTDLHAAAPADLDTAAYYTVDLSTGEAQGPNDEVASAQEAFGLEEDLLGEDLLDAIDDSDAYRVDQDLTDDDSAFVYAPYARHRILLYTDQEPETTFGATDAAYYTEDGGYRLCYDSDEETRAAYEGLAALYGEDALVLDLPVSILSEETSPDDQEGLVLPEEAGETADTAHGWGTAFMGLDQASANLDADGSGQKVTVAVLDTGILASHQAFLGRTILADSTSLVTGDSNPFTDANGHGTSVAGIISESTPASVDLLVIQIANAAGDSSLDNMTTALDYAAKHGADVANISLNAYYGKTGYSDAVIQNSIEKMDSKLKAVADRGLVICVAAGNEGNSSNSRLRDIDKGYNYPAMSDYVICTGSIDKSAKHSTFSCYGESLDFVAPGEAVECASNSSDTSWVSKRGTSMSSPYIASAAAIVKTTEPDADLSRITRALAAAADDLGEEGKDALYGYGVPRFSADYAGKTQSLADSLGIELPEGWDPDDPGSYKAYEQMYDSDLSQMALSDGSGEALLSTSAITATTKWRIYDSSKYNASTKKHSGKTYASFSHDSKNTSNADIIPVIDVSYHNDSPTISSDNINWNLVKDEGIEGVIIRCGYRAQSKGTLCTDTQFFNFIKAAKNAGLKVGVYFFTQAITETEGKKEAEYTIKLIQQSKVALDLPVVIDVEHYPSGGKGRLGAKHLSKSAQTKIAAAFCETVKKAGYTPMIYSSSAFFVGNMDGKALADKGYQLWMARYRYAAYSDGSQFYADPVEIWQCSSSAAVNGIKTATDLNYWYAKGKAPAGKSYPVADAVTDDQVKNFTAKADSNSQVTLTWDQVSGAAGYRIYYYSAYGRDASKVYDIKKGSTTKKVLTGLKEGHELRYVIQPLMDNGYGEASDQISVVVKQTSAPKIITLKKLSLKELPNAGKKLGEVPKGTYVKRVAYIGGNDGNTWFKITYDGVTGYISGASTNSKYYIARPKAPVMSGTYKTQVHLKWSKVSGAEQYAIYRASARNGSYKKVATVDASVLTWKDTGRVSGTEYYYKIRAMKKISGSWKYSDYSALKVMHTKKSRTIRLQTTVDANLRKYAGTSYSKLTVVPVGKKLTVIYTTKDNTGKTWYKVRYKKNGKTYTGYLSTVVVKKV